MKTMAWHAVFATLALCALANGAGAATTELERLPLAAQGAIASVLGRDMPVYHARPSRRGFIASNPRHAFEASFTPTGVEIRADRSKLGLVLRAVGRGATLRPVAMATPVATDNRVEYRRGALTEWYANGPLGLEQGFTLERPPVQGAGAVTLALAVSGTVASLEPGADALTFAGSSLRYCGLLAFDASGRELPARLHVRGNTLLLQVDDQGARYPLTIDPFVQQAKLTASDGAMNDVFGTSVAIDGDTLVVGAPGDDVANVNQGSVYVFVKPATGWAGATETAKLTASDHAASDNFGWSVAISGHTIVVGAILDDSGANVDQGSAYVFVKPASGWASGTETAKLTASDGAAGDTFGVSVAVSGNTVVVGAYVDDIGINLNQGSAYVYVKPASGWASATETAKLTASDGAAGDFFGNSVAVAGDTIYVGAPFDTIPPNLSQGSAYVFVKPAAGWASVPETAKLTASDGATNDNFGRRVAVSGDALVITADGDNIGANFDQGSAYVFVKPAAGWASGTQTAKLTASDGAANDRFGLSVAVSEDSVVVGALFDDVGASVDQGSAYVFVEPAAGWASATETEKLIASDGAAGDNFGWSVSQSFDTILVGANSDDIGATANQGSAYVFAPPGGPDPPASLALSPTDDMNAVGTSHTVTASVEDASASPTPDIVVRFSVTGSVTTSGSCTTDAAGQCDFTYDGPQLPGADVISAYADSNNNNVQDPGEPSDTTSKTWILPVSTSGHATGGGQIADAAGNKITFSFEVKSNGGLKGGCNVIDQAANRKIKCLDVTALVLSGNQVVFFGNATDNGTATIYRIHATDAGEPGRGEDTFSILTASGYSRSGTLRSGNVKIH
jgi:hypothetical protein